MSAGPPAYHAVYDIRLLRLKITSSASERVRSAHDSCGVPVTQHTTSAIIMSERRKTTKPAAKRLRTSGKYSSGAFASAAALMDSTNRLGNDDYRKKCDDSTDRGFCSAMDVLDSPDIINGDEKKSGSIDVQVPGANAVNQREQALAVMSQEEPTDFQIMLTMVGWKYYKDLHEAPNIPSMGTRVLLEREVDNEHDSNAIAVHNALNHTQIGHITKEDAALLASHVDNGAIKISNASIRKRHKASFQILVEGVASGSSAVMEVVNHFKRRSKVDAESLSQKIAKLDVERSQSASYTLQDLEALLWNPVPDWKAATETQSLSWAAAPFDTSKFHCPPLTVQEIEVAKTASWPPSDDILMRLGMAPPNDEDWWKNVAGLLPPGQWNVSGALDVLPKIQTSARSQRHMASTTLDGAIHGVTDVWHPDTLAAMGQLMQEPNFWCRRSGDALFRAFGGPYVLGQKEEDLKLVRGAPHTELTRTYTGYVVRL